MTTIRQAINSFPKGTTFSMDDFISACPYTMDELRKRDRHTDIKQWRHVGMTFYALENNNILRTGRYFNMDHASVIHAIKNVMFANQGFDPDLKDKIDSVLHTRANYLVYTSDINVNEVTALRHLEFMMSSKLC